MWYGEFLDYNDDIKDVYLAVLMSAFFNDVTCKVNSDNEKAMLEDFVEGLLNSYLPYYYAFQENYHEFKEDDCVSDNVIEFLHLDKDNTTVTFTNVNHDKLMQVFDSYFKKYLENDLESEDNILTCEAYNERLHNILTKEDYNLSRFHVKDISYIKPICYGYYNDQIFIHNMSIEFDENLNVKSFDCYADFTGFVNYANEPKETKSPTSSKVTTSKPKRKRTHFSDSVQDLYDYIKKYAPAKNYEIYKEDLIGDDRRNKLYCGMGELTTAVNRLNNQYKEIYGLDKPLMKYDKFLDCYLIQNVWDN